MSGSNGVGRRLAEETFRRLHPSRQTDRQIRADFIAEFFESEAQFNGFAFELLRETDEARYVGAAHDALADLPPGINEGTINQTVARRLYALVRSLRPRAIVETGVCNGLSTAYLLAALHRNQWGQLYSVDYPLRADQSLDEFREETFSGFGGAAIPADRDPGWIIPDRLRERWLLVEGKSQEKLPALVDDVGPIDLFIHDSEHSASCMAFEFDLAYSRLIEGGAIVADDIWSSPAWEWFVRERGLREGRVGQVVGWARD